MPERLEKLKHWLESELDFSEYRLKPASADASFRRYFRVQHQGESLIVMDAPPDNENSRPFIDISRLLFDVGLNVPAVIDYDLEQGFLLLSDLGSRSYLDELNGDSVERLYGDALSALATIQTCIPGDAGLPAYDRALLLKELELFREWLIESQVEQDKACMDDLCVKYDLTSTAQAYKIIFRAKQRFRTILRERLHSMVGQVGDVDREIGEFIAAFSK